MRRLMKAENAKVAAKLSSHCASADCAMAVQGKCRAQNATQPAYNVADAIELTRRTTEGLTPEFFERTRNPPFNPDAHGRHTKLGGQSADLLTMHTVLNGRPEYVEPLGQMPVQAAE